MQRAVRASIALLLAVSSAAGCGSSGKAGGAGAAGTAGAMGTAGSSGGGCITPAASLSAKIATVGIVTFTTSLAGPTAAQIDFGRTTSYGMTAPVDLAQPGYRTLLLGMKADTTYHYRVTVSNASGACQGEDRTLTTGALADGLPKVTVSPASSTVSGLSGGFLITGQFVTGTGAGSAAYILDADADYVWWFVIDGDVGSARMSYDGSHMWVSSVNVPEGTTRVHRVSMDGLIDEDLSSPFSGQNHQLTVEPDETVAFYAYGSNGCDDLKEYTPATGAVRTIVNTQTAQQLPAGTMCHINNVQYSRADDALVFSDLDSNTLVKVKRSDGAILWNLNGAHATFSGASWAGGQHGIHLIDLTHVLIFNNNNNGPGGSNAIELLLDTTTDTATEIWRYTPTNPAVQNVIMGDLQRMPNGNTVIAYSTRGLLHEVTADGTPLQTWSWPTGSPFGYIEKRATLYGPPPR